MILACTLKCVKWGTIGQMAWEKEFELALVLIQIMVRFSCLYGRVRADHLSLIKLIAVSLCIDPYNPVDIIM